MTTTDPTTMTGADSDGYPVLALLIDGSWRETASGGARPVRDPATREPVGWLPLAGERETEEAVVAAARAFPTWRATSAEDRARLLRRAAERLRASTEATARAMSLENGKAIREARDEVGFSADILDFFAEEATRSVGSVAEIRGGTARLVHEPIGPIAAFTTWNYPLTVPTRKVGAALAGGSTVVLKPDEDTPASALALAHALVDAGLPAGVLNVVFGDPAAISTTLIAAPSTRKVSFTGSARVGAVLAGRAAKQVKPIMLELGGHAPVLVFPDADIQEVAVEAVRAKMHNAGQSCGSPTRFYVHEAVHDEFVDAFRAAAERIVVGPGAEDSSDMGALGNARRLEAMAPLVDDAIASGAALVLGGRGSQQGYFWTPTLLTDVPPSARAMNEEPFGPLALTATFQHASEAVALANRLPYGLAAYVFAEATSVIASVSAGLEVGMVGVNRFGVGDHTTYFGGAKGSGYGAEGGKEAIREYQVPKLVVS